MTVGTDTLLKPISESLLRQFVRSLFINPLMLDLAHLDEQSAKVKATEVTMRQVGHILEVPLISTKNLLAKTINGWKERSELTHLIPQLKKVRTQVQHMQNKIFVAKVTRTGRLEDLSKGTCRLDQIVVDYLPDPADLGFDVHLPPPQGGQPRPVFGSEEAWENVIWTLVYNAIQNSPVGETVHLVLEYQPRPQSRMRTPTMSLTVTNKVDAPVPNVLVEYINKALRADIEELPEEFVKGEGHGLGLAVVGRFVRSLEVTAKAIYSDKTFQVCIEEVKVDDG